MRINQEEFNKWIEALRSGEYKQAKDFLNEPYSDGFCCLGVACNELIDEPLMEPNGITIAGKIPSDQPNAPKWLLNINQNFYKKTNKELTVLNDIGVAPAHFEAEPFTFDEIADLLEAVYVHKVLD